MLTRPQFYLLNIAIAGASLALAFGGRAWVRSSGSDEGGLLEYVVVGVALAIGGVAMAYASFRRAAGDQRLPPPIDEDPDA
jgi:hypothetical protein